MAKLALLIGEDNRLSSNSQPSAADNVVALKQVLQHPEIGCFTEVKTRINPDSLVLQQEIEALFGDRQRDDLVLLYFCGHGIKNSQGKLYLATSSDYPGTQGKTLRSAVVPTSFIQDVMNSSQAHQQVVILDCWSSSAAEDWSAQARDSGDDKPQFNGQRQAILIASTPANGSLAPSDRVFTRALIKGLETGAADLDHDGVIAVDEWHEYTKGHLQTAATQSEIYTMKVGHKILLAKAPVIDPNQKYRQEVERRTRGGEISPVARGILDVVRDRLDLSPQDAAAIETSVLSPHQSRLPIQSAPAPKQILKPPQARTFTPPQEAVTPPQRREIALRPVTITPELTRTEHRHPKPAKVALLVGVSQYGAGFNPLPGTTKDVEAIRQVLQHPERGGFAEVKTLNNPDPLALQQAIEALFGDCQTDDLVLLYFSGHGVKDDRGKLYLTTGTTRKDTQGKLVKSTAISASFLQDVMSDSQSQRQVVVLDCWFGATFTQNWLAEADSSVDIKNQLGGPGRIVLTSSTSTESAFDQKGSGLSTYTDYWVEGLETGAADLDNDGMVSLEELHEYTCKKVQKSTPAAQPAIYSGHTSEQILLAKAPSDDLRLRYRKEVERCVSYGGLSIVSRSILDVLQEKLGLAPEEAAAIEGQVLKPHRAYQKKLQRYTQVLVEAVQQEYPLRDETRSRFKRVQQVLGLQDQDVTLIEVQVARQVKGDHAQATPTSLKNQTSRSTEAVPKALPNPKPVSTPAPRGLNRLTATRTPQVTGSTAGADVLSPRVFWLVSGAGIIGLLALVGLGYGQRQWRDSQPLEQIQTLAQQKNYEACLSAGQTVPQGSSRYSEAQKLLRQCEAGVNWQNVQVQTLPGHSETVWSIAISPDGQTLASGSNDGTIKLWNLGTGNLLQTFAVTGPVWSVAISADGQTLASGSSDQTIKTWNLRTGQLLHTFSGHSDTVRSVAISADGQTLASGSSDQTIKTWNLRTGQLLHTFSGHTGRVISTAISRDAQTLISSSDDNTIKLWNLPTGKLIRTLSGHTDHVNTVAISPSGQTLASGGEDRTIKLWNLQTGELLQTFSQEASDIYAIAFSSDRQTLVSGNKDGTIKLRRRS